MNRRALHVPAAALTALLLAGALAACDVRIDTGSDATGDEVTETRDITAVTRVELRTTGTLNLAVGAEPGLSVTGRSDVLDDLTTTVEGDTLVIDLDRSWRRTGFLEYDLVLPALSGVVLSGSGGVFGVLGGDDAVELRIDGSGEMGIKDLAADEITAAIHGSGDITLRDVSASDVDIVVEGSGDIEVSGRTDHVRVAIPGSGSVDAAALDARTGDVTIDGSGETTVNVAETLAAAIDGSGDITYLGEPEVERRIDGSGDIEHG